MEHSIVDIGRKRKQPSSNIVQNQMPPPPPPQTDKTVANVSSTTGQDIGPSAPNVEGNTTAPNVIPPPTVNKTRSDIWAHFEKIADADGKNTERVLCVWCRKNYQGRSDLGTSGLWKHLRESCKKFPYKKQFLEAHKKKDKTQATLNFQTPLDGEKGSLSFFKFDQKVCRESVVEMIIMDELPFRYVERKGFKRFCSRNIPEFQVPSRFTIREDCYALFLQEKKKLKALLASQCQRISLTTDTWTSIQNMSYMCLTGHFIDNEWHIQKRILNFCTIKSHKGVNIGNVIDSCMEEWGLKGVMCITVDNASSNDTVIQQLKKRLTLKKAFVLGGDGFHMRCCVHILQLIVKDGIKMVDESIGKIRDVVKHIRSSPQRLDLFKKCCESVQVKYKKALSLDCPTRWNSTYLMLEVALGYQKAFQKLEYEMNIHVSDVMDRMPLEHDWINAKNFCRFLKRFYDATCRLSGSCYSTASMYFPEIMRILKDLKVCQSSRDSSLKMMGDKMRAKFDKYWGSFQKINVCMFIAVVLDPRYKMNYLLVKYTEFYSEGDAKELVAKVKKAMNDLIDGYKLLNEAENITLDKESPKSSEEDDGSLSSDEIDEYFLRATNNENVAAQGELDRYLEELPEKFTTNFDLLGWWKINFVRYPLLSKVAKDILAIQCSTVASESAFSTSGRTLDKFRSSLTPTTAEVLICCQDWLMNSSDPIQLEEQEAFESDIRKNPEMAANIFTRAAIDC